jgi:hypothetical protein
MLARLAITSTNPNCLFNADENVAPQATAEKNVAAINLE